MRRHIQIHKRTENYNPRQRKLRNVIVQDADRNPGKNEALEAAEETDYVPEAAEVEESTIREPDSGTGLGCIVRVVIGSSDAAMEEVVSDQNLGDAEGFSVPEVLQQSQLVSEAYESSMDMEGMVEKT